MQKRTNENTTKRNSTDNDTTRTRKPYEPIQLEIIYLEPRDVISSSPGGFYGPSVDFDTSFYE